MITIVILVMIASLLSVRPLKYAILIIALSTCTALFLFKLSLSSWMPLVLIIVFSSGMITLFIYISSLAPIRKRKQKYPLLPLLLFRFWYPLKLKKDTIKLFTSQTFFIFIILILVLTILVISCQSFNPHQAMTSTF